jgi:hypothetical protein
MAAAPKDEGMFRRLHSSERKRILQTIGSHKTELTAKTESDELFTFSSGPFENDKYLHCTYVKGQTKPNKDQAVVINFVHGFERYFFQGFVTLTPDKVIVEALDVYILQRRKSVRMRIPEKFDLANFNCIHMKGKASFHEMRIIDFSSGGVRVFYPHGDPVFDIGDKFLGVLHLGNRKPMQMGAVVRHIIKKKLWDQKGQIIGIQFDGLNKTMEIKLLTVFMDLHREIFVKNFK